MEKSLAIDVDTAIAFPMYQSIWGAVLLVFITGLLLKRFKWYDSFAVLAFIVLVLPPIFRDFRLDIPLAVALFLMLLFAPEKEFAGRRDKLEWVNILLAALVLAPIFGGCCFAQIDGEIKSNIHLIDVVVALMAGISSLSLYFKRGLRNYIINAFNALLAFGLYLAWFAIFSVEIQENAITGQAAGFTFAAYLALVALFLRLAFTIYLAIKTSRA